MTTLPDEKLTIIVPEELAGKRLDQTLATLYPQHSRARLQAWIREGNVKVDDKVLRQKYPVKAGETIIVYPIHSVEEKSSGEDIPLDIIYEDDEIIVLNKPAGLVVHPGAGNPKHTLLNALLYYNKQLEYVPRAGIVQRLDKDTSGIMVVAKTPIVHTYLVDQLQKRLVKREYQAIVFGVMTSGGRIDAPIGRHPTQRKRMAVVTNGKPAITHYRILKKYASFTHVQIHLETGRTHQIRVHLAHIHYPIVSDGVYAGRERLPKNSSQYLRETIQSFPRQALHATQLGLKHPVSKHEMTWAAPIANDIQKLIDTLDREST